MNEALIGLAGVVVGTVLATLSDLVRARSAFRREKAWGLLEDKRRRIEETYEAVELHREAYKDLLTRALGTLLGQRADPATLMRVPWPRLRMLVHLHVPEMLPELASIEKAGDRFGVEAARAMAGGSDVDAKAMQRSALEAFAVLHKAYDDFVVKLVGLGTALVRTATESTQKLPGRSQRGAIVPSDQPLRE